MICAIWHMLATGETYRDLGRRMKPFVDDVSSGVERAALARAVVGLGETLGLRTVAEGIETAEQWEFLASRGCSEMQGYYVSRPLEAADLEKFISKSRVKKAT